MLEDIIHQMNDAGLRVFPLLGSHDLDGEKLDEKEAFKRPRHTGWQHTPDSWSDEQMDVLFETGQFNTGYGIVCRDLIVIDVDPRNGGLKSLEALLEKVPEIAGAGMIVETGRRDGGKHYYFRAPSPSVAMVQHLKGFDGIDAKSSGFVVGPGSMHASGNEYRILSGSPDEIDEAPAALVDLLRKPDYHRAEYNGTSMDVTEADIADMLSYINPDVSHDEWVRVGMAVHDATGGAAFNLWDQWSAQGAKYPTVEALERRWHSFGKASMPVTIGTLIHYAEEGGWKRPVTFEADHVEDVPAPLLSTEHIDLLRPPGFVGEVCEWINDQCRYPREHLAVVASLVVMGNIVGLRYTDDIDGATANLFGFGVADSGSGKDSVYKAFNKIMRAAGLTPALHGMQKSEQEVVRNLLRHQPAYYNIDEFGIHLQKVVNASKKGSASYLEGLIGILMNTYSKADDFLPIGGDTKEEVKKELVRQVSQARKAIEENDDKHGKHSATLKRAEKALEAIDNGIDRPFVSVMGMTTPSTFDLLVTPDQATSGFIGRALIVREVDPNPKAKYPFKKRPMSESMEGRLSSLVIGGEFDVTQDRIEYYNDRVQIRTEPAAAEALQMVYHEFWEFAERQKEATGLTPIPRRGYEMVAKVSLILAAPSGVRTLEHVRWAYALVKHDIDEKLRLVVSNDQTYGGDMVLFAKISKLISKDHGETFGVIKNRLRSYKPEDVQKALDLMVSRGQARKEETKHPSNGTTVTRWFYSG